MGLLDFLFQKKTASAPVKKARTAAPSSGGASLSFDPAFIPKLKEEHQSLLAIFVQIKNAYQARDFGGVKSFLQDFQTALNLHLAVENSKFYAYLRRNLEMHSPELATMNSFFDEMQEIGKVVTTFLRHYISAEFTAEIQASFGRELEAIGAALVSRIEREEETLYKLYAPA